MSDEAIAIVGASCRFPGAVGLDAFWRLLIEGGDAVGEIGPERWSTRLFRHPAAGIPGKSYSFACGLLDDVEQFEPGFFGISPREAEQVDPRQRLLLELTWHALEDAGIPAERLAGQGVGVYIGASATDYADLRLGDPASGDAYFLTGSSLGILANRISQLFDLRGPSLVVDTACSSSLVALHQACEALRAGDIGGALVGGVNLLLSPYPFVGFAQASMLSRRGRCFAFDARADGYVRAEGGAVVVLKRLSQAVADGDAIRGLIHATAVASSGRTIGLSLPSEAAQADLLRATYAKADIDPAQLGFVEAHGTGTPAGDPAEAAALGRILGQPRAAALPIGSVKTNIGHLEAASGMAGLLKAMLALEHGIVPRSLYGETPNPAIPFAALNLRIVRANEKLSCEVARFAGINSFGFGGTNAHAVLAAAPQNAPIAAASTVPPLLISARSRESLRMLAARWRDIVAAAPPHRAATLLRAAARRRDHHPHRLVVPVAGDLAAGLDSFLGDGADDAAAISGIAQQAGDPVFVYSGNGAQFFGMGREAYRHSAAFRDAIRVVDASLAPRLGWSVAERVADGGAEAALRCADVAQPMLFAIQAAITETVRGLGIVPAAFLGHSVGEITAAWGAGALSLDDASRLIAARSRHQQRTRGTGRMAALALGEADARQLITEVSTALTLAAINSTRSVTIAGPEVAVAALAEAAARRGVGMRVLDLDFAFHSALMEPVRDELLTDIAGIAGTPPTSILVSTVTGGRVDGTLDAAHWWRNIRDPVRFAEAAAALVADGHRLFVEIGPAPMLQSYLRDALRAADASGHVLASLDRRELTDDPFPAILARLYVAGCDISGAVCFDGPNDPRGLPLYAWQRTRYWFGRTVEAIALVDPVCDHPLLGFRSDGPETSWRNHLDTALFPFLADHRIDGMPVLPAAAIIDMALAAARTQQPDAATLELCDVELVRPLPLASDELRESRFVLVSPEGDWRLSSRRRLVDEPLSLHASGSIAGNGDERLLPHAEPMIGAAEMSGTMLYRLATRLGLDYGDSFRTVTSVIADDTSSRAVVRLSPRAHNDNDGYLIDPAQLDGALQGMLALLAADGGAAPEAGFLPRRFDRVRAVAPFGRVPRLARLRLTRRGTRSAVGDIALYDEHDDLVAELAGCRFARVGLHRGLAAAGHCLHVDLVPAPLDPAPAPAVLDRTGEIVGAFARPAGAAETGETLLFDALVAAVALEAARGLGDLTTVAPHARPLLERLLLLLRRFGAGSEETGTWRLVADNDLPDVGDLWRSMLADTPDRAAELALVAALRDRLPALLRDGAPAGDASPIAEALRQATAAIAAGRAALAAALDALAAEWPANRMLRLCEPAGTHLSERLMRRRATVIRVPPGETCDIAIGIDARGGDLARLCAGLVPGGVVLSVMPSVGPVDELLRPEHADEIVAWPPPGFADGGAIRVAHAPWPCELRWARLPNDAEAVAASPPGPSLAVLGDPDLADALATLGHRLADPATAGDGLVLAAGTNDPVADLPRLLSRCAHIAAIGARRQVPVWLVTSAASGEPGDAGVAGAALAGFGRVLRNEFAGLVLRHVALAPGMPAAERAACLTRELASASAETEIVWTASGRRVPRLRRGLPPRWAEPRQPIAATVERPGRVERLTWAPAALRDPGSGEIAIDVHAVGVNFRDVMWATGVLPEEALADGFAGAALGLECAGTVRGVGDGVRGYAVGDRVVGFAPAAMASHVVTRADAVIAIPPSLGFAAAATLPVAFVTAIYALETLARLEPGEHVLIHAAAGGVGLAAIQIAKRCGAQVIATAGAPEKRAFLRLVGADHVCDSRDLRFVSAVREATAGAGVDVVLNSLHGEAMKASLDLLKPFGRFVELGKRDFYENRRIHARLLRRNTTYFAVDVDQLPLQRPELARALLARVATALAAEEIRPLAHRCFAFAETGDALRLMQAAQQIGKLVVVPDDLAGIELQRTATFSARRDGCYVVTGGVDGFGFAAARFLAEHGAGYVALIGRRGAATPGAGQRADELRTLGARVSLHAADVGDEAALAAALDAIRAGGVPVRGVVHAAAASADGMAADLEAADIAAALRGKLGGALALDRLTRGDPLDLFWLFSSATTLVAAPGQAAYVAANHAVEALARRRHTEGLPALAIAWGPIADEGRLAARPEERAALTRRLATRAMRAAAALAALPAMAASGLPVVGLADADWSDARHVLPVLSEPFFAEMRPVTDEVAADPAPLGRLDALDETGRRQALEAMVAEEAARILRLADGSLDRRRPLADIGMDSLMALELRLAVETRLRIDLPLMSLADGVSVATLAARLSERLGTASQVDTLAEIAARHEAPLDPFALGGTAPAADE